MNKKKIIPLLTLLTVILAITAIAGGFTKKANINAKIPVGKGIIFIEDDWEKALAAAKKEHKQIFLDAYATWCGPCKLLKKQTFPDAAVGDFFNKNFINIAVNMEKGVGPELLQKYGVTAYPTLIITDENGNMVTYTRGYMEAKQLLSFGKHGLSLQK